MATRLQDQVALIVGASSGMGLATARLFAREDGTTPLVGFNWSNSVDNECIEIAAEMVSGKRKRISFAPMVWMTGCLMAYEAFRVILQKPGGPGVGGALLAPLQQLIEP